MKSPTWRRYGALVTSGVLTAGLVLTTPGTASAAPAADEQGARWLEGELTNGLVHNDQFSFDDYGLTADFGFALAEIDGHRPTVKQIGRKLAKNVDNYTTFMGDIFAGPTAKALVLAQTADVDPKDFGGVNLVGRLSRRVSSDKPIIGRIEDKTPSDDFANTIGQAFAAQGLDAARSGKADEVLKFLLKQQCAKGWFRLNFAKKHKNKQSCDAGDRKTTSAPDTDVTALAVLSLLSLRDLTPKVRRAIDDAVSWLQRKQANNGSFGGGPATEAANTNSTGLAAWAMGEAGSCGAANKAARWISKLQVAGNLAGTEFKGEKGAIAYDKAAYREAEEDGIDVEERDQWRRATAQAAPALLYLVVDGCD